MDFLLILIVVCIFIVVLVQLLTGKCLTKLCVLLEMFVFL